MVPLSGTIACPAREGQATMIQRPLFSRNEVPWLLTQDQLDLGEFLAKSNLKLRSQVCVDPTAGHNVDLTLKLLRSFFKCFSFVRA
jgi:hypothetical protein